MDDRDVERYLERIGVEVRPTVDLAGLDELHRAHLSTVPFENLDVYAGVDVSTDPSRSLAKILGGCRGGWCFELNGAFGGLLTALGFDVRYLGAAVLLSGPTAVVSHLCLDVTLDEPYLVDVGFGDSFSRPLALNRTGPQDGGTGTFELLPSPEGTTLTRTVDGTPEAQYRFSRVARSMPDFEEPSQRLQNDTALNWHQRAFATRLLDGGPDRVSLIGNRLKFHGPDSAVETEVDDAEWSATLLEHFGIVYEPEGGPWRARTA
ncbi:MAG: arylamine N-acetyltransferase [Acidimicrobiia bacterium]|nr:arylamine N-acetyltransferase [Acidimicrobiia bacterium]